MTSDRPDRPGADASTVFLSVDLPAPVAIALAGGRRLLRLTLNELTAERLQAEDVQIVGCPLISGATDALMVIEVLKAASFVGSLLVIAPRLPDPGMVERELRSAAHPATVRMVSL